MGMTGALPAQKENATYLLNTAAGYELLLLQLVPLKNKYKLITVISYHTRSVCMLSIQPTDQCDHLQR